MDRTSISSRAAQWAANHRRAAILGWIAFVAIAFLIGGAVGTKTIADEDLGNGESRQAEQIIADAGYPEDDYESVLVQGKDGQTTTDPQFRAAISDTERRLSRVAHVSGIESPLEGEQRGPGLRRRPLGAGRVRAPRRPTSRWPSGSRRRWPRSPRHRARIRSSRSRSSATPAPTRRSTRPSRTTSSGRDALAADHAADPAGRLRRARRRRRAAAARRSPP